MNNELSSQGEVIANVLLKKTHPLVMFSEQLFTDYKKWHGLKRINKLGWKLRKIPIDQNSITSIAIIKAMISELISRGITPAEDFDIEKWLPEFTVEITIANSNGKKMGSGLTVHSDDDAYQNKTYTIIIYMDNTSTGGELNIYNKNKFFGLLPGDYVGCIPIQKTEDIKRGYRQVIFFGGKTFHKPGHIINGQRILISLKLSTDIHHFL